MEFPHLIIPLSKKCPGKLNALLEKMSLYIRIMNSTVCITNHLSSTAHTRMKQMEQTKCIISNCIQKICHHHFDLKSGLDIKYKLPINKTCSGDKQHFAHRGILVLVRYSILDWMKVFISYNISKSVQLYQIFIKLGQLNANFI